MEQSSSLRSSKSVYWFQEAQQYITSVMSIEIVSSIAIYVSAGLNFSSLVQVVWEV